MGSLKSCAACLAADSKLRNEIAVALLTLASDVAKQTLATTKHLEQPLAGRIIVDVLLLLASFYYSDHFHTIIRNFGFVLSTILIKLSFSVSGILNNALIIGSVLFGLLILYIHQLYERAHLTSR